MKKFLSLLLSLLLASSQVHAGVISSGITGVRASQVIPTTGTFAAKAACTSELTGYTYFATDIGSGINIICDGTKWKPSTGSAIVGQSWVSKSVAGTGSTVTTTLDTVNIPAAMLSPNGCLEFDTLWETNNNNANAKQIRIDIGASTILNANALANTLSATDHRQFCNQNLTNSQRSQTLLSISYGATGNASVVTTENTTNALAITFKATITTAGDTEFLRGYTIRWNEP